MTALQELTKEQVDELTEIFYMYDKGKTNLMRFGICMTMTYQSTFWNTSQVSRSIRIDYFGRTQTGHNQLGNEEK